MIIWTKNYVYITNKGHETYWTRKKEINSMIIIILQLIKTSYTLLLLIFGQYIPIFFKETHNEYKYRTLISEYRTISIDLINAFRILCNLRFLYNL